jgi:sulfur carrier protein
MPNQHFTRGGAWAAGTADLSSARRVKVDTKTDIEISVVLNGRGVATAATTLDALLAEQGFAGLKVATALNGDFVPAPARAATSLASGDRIEVVSARQGG